MAQGVYRRPWRRPAPRRRRVPLTVAAVVVESAILGTRSIIAGGDGKRTYVRGSDGARGSTAGGDGKRTFVRGL